MKFKVYILNFLLFQSVFAWSQQPNILVITADDMNWNTVATFGGEQQGENVTPNIDKLALEGVRFINAHVASTACMPSRNAINTGRLPHRSGGEGFHDLRFKDIPTIPNVFDANGYFVGILGKVPHSTPYEGVTPWHLAEEMERNTNTFYQRTSEVIDSALNTVGKPFYLIVNSHDPHRPYYSLNSVGTDLGDSKSHPSKIYYPEDVIMPSWLPEHENTRKEMAEYLCTSRRLDDVVGEALKVLDEQGIADNTLVFFLSDHGMAAPSIKSNIYHHATKTPLIMRWPNNANVLAGSTVEELVSVLDIFPTITEACGIDEPTGLDGKSLLPLLAGQTQSGRDTLFSTYNTTIGKNIYGFRKVHSSKYAYIFNPWHDGRTTYNSSSLGASFFETMLNIGQTDNYWQERCDFILIRTPEEFYDVELDPDCLNNLIDDAAYADEITEFKASLVNVMTQSDDYMLSVYQTWETTQNVTSTYNEFVRVIEENDLVGHAPNFVDVDDKWTIYPPEGSIYAEDFENTIYKYGVLGGATVDIVENPKKEGINTSDQVLRVIREDSNRNSYVGTSAVVGVFDAPRYLHMKILKDRASATYFQFSTADNGNKVKKGPMSPYDADRLGEWQDLVFDMGEYNDCGKIFIQPDHSTDWGSYTTYVDDIILNNDPHSRELMPTGIDVADANNLSVYPNPANNRLYIDNIEYKNVQIVDVKGKVIKHVSYQTAQSGIDVSDLNIGYYFVRISQDKQVLVRKFLKK
ncbi:sulfatase-like hydrolase/transferase [Saccharicrinis aurantiacus]|uniref:sulfatase-like hydrolase/transferase n=1 Tax=Saccharicrinis aurantiacus TaxID=1849719 RepID=UPI00249042E6|nr:sulfatase-like hydrolase/transferase [Saccharicrinis aurantiacus]